MWKSPWAALLTAAVLISSSACAALEETRKNGAHFATWQHMGYSLWRAPPRVFTLKDIVASHRDKWWGQQEVIWLEPIQYSATLLTYTKFKMDTFFGLLLLAVAIIAPPPGLLPSPHAGEENA